MADGLWNLYAGAGIQSSTAKSIGSVAGLASAGSYHRGRKKKIVRDLATGKVKANQLGAGDLASLGLSSSGSKINPGDVGGGSTGVGGFFKNLGSDIYDVAKGLGPGLLQLGTAIFHDIGPRGPLFTGKSAVSDKVIKPVVEQYKKTYSGDILQNLYNHPLQPILDVATLASGGAAGAAKVGRVAQKRGVEGGVANLARITSREGRAPAVTQTGISIPREYTPRPLSKLGQMGIDKLGQHIDPVGNWQGKKALQRDLKLTDVQSKGQAARIIADVGKPIADRFKNLELPEQIALGLSLRGINTPELVTRAQEGFRTSLADPEINAKAEALGIDRVYRETLARPDIGIANLVSNPTPAMREAAKIWGQDVERGLEELPITPEQHAAHISSYQRRLLAEDPEHPLEASGYETTVPEGAIAPNYVPDLRASGYKPHRQGEKLNRLTRGLTPQGQLTFRRGPAERLNSTSAITSQNLLTPNSQRYLHDSSGETFDQGLFRIDPRLYVEHASKREKDLIENAFNAQLVEKYAHKDENGEMTKFKDPGEVEATLGPNWVHVNPEYPIAWFRSETNFTKQAEQVMKRLQEANADDAVVLERMLEEITDADAKAFIITNWGAMKRPGVAIPRDFFEYQKQLVGTTEPFNNPAMRAYAKFMHHWRNTVLAYMPRWGLNTAIGSFITNMVKGVMNPQFYIEGDRLRRTYVNPETGEHVTRGLFDRDFDTQGLERAEPVGIAMQEQAMAEMLEPSMAAYQQAMDIRMPTRKLVAGVQHIEDFFRRASFQHSLHQIRKREGHENPEVELSLANVVERETPEELTPMEELMDRPAPDAQHYDDPFDDPNSPHVAVNSALLEKTRPPERRGGSEEDAEYYEDEMGSWANETHLAYYREGALEYPDEFPDEVRGALMMGDMKDGTRLIHQEKADESQGYPFDEPGTSYTFMRFHDGGKPAAMSTILVGDETSKVLDSTFAWDKQMFREDPDGEDLLVRDTAERIARLMGSKIEQQRPNPEGPPEAVLESMGDVLSDHYERVTHARGSIEEMLSDPKLVDRAIRDVNKFGYNYGALGPWERRYVRQFIPFWGWYKFISSLAYRLPVELPGRTQALQQLAMIGNDSVDDLGMVPEWMKGSIILGVNEDGSVKYLPTMGMNPFSSFFNPMSPKGSVEGMISSGMASPLIQAGLQAYGYDTLTGDAVRVSPQSGVTQDFMGRLINDKGEVVSARSVAPLRRGLMGLVRSIPQFRLGEKHALEGGGSVYPESVPLLAPRPMSPASDDAFTTGSGAGDVGLAMIGLNPRGYDLANYQNITAKRARYNMKKRRRDLMKLKRKFEE